MSVIKMLIRVILITQTILLLDAHIAVHHKYPRDVILKPSPKNQNHLPFHPMLKASPKREQNMPVNPKLQSAPKTDHNLPLSPLLKSATKSDHNLPKDPMLKFAPKSDDRKVKIFCSGGGKACRTHAALAHIYNKKQQSSNEDPNKHTDEEKDHEITPFGNPNAEKIFKENIPTNWRTLVLWRVYLLIIHLVAFMIFVIILICIMVKCKLCCFKESNQNPPPIKLVRMV